VVKNKLAFCFTFQDDLEVASRTDKEHRQHLCTIFLRLREHGLVINAEKCIFGVPSIDFLGHRVGAAGVTPLPQYVSAVVDFPQPSTVKELQAFLGMLKFYRQFLLSIADILRLLTDSLRGGKKGDDRLEWSTATLQAFQASKKALTGATYLAHPLPRAALSLAFDASATHVGARLHQRRQGSAVWEPLGFFSAGRAAVCPADRPQAAHVRPWADFGGVDG
jgi:hypothetical protein